MLQSVSIDPGGAEWYEPYTSHWIIYRIDAVKGGPMKGRICRDGKCFQRHITNYLEVEMHSIWFALVVPGYAGPTHTTSIDVATRSPVWDVVRRFQGWSGVPVSVELAPHLYRQEPHKLGTSQHSILQAPEVSYSVPVLMGDLDVTLNSWLQTHNQLLLSQGRCERYEAIDRPYGFHVRPTRAWADGECNDYQSPLDEESGLDGALQSTGGVTELFSQHGISLRGVGWPGRVETTQTASLESVLTSVLMDAPGLTYKVHMIRRGEEAAWIVHLIHVGHAVIDLDPDEFPHHMEHRDRAFRASMSDAQRARSAALLAERNALLRAQGVEPPSDPIYLGREEQR